MIQRTGAVTSTGKKGNPYCETQKGVKKQYEELGIKVLKV